MGVVVWWGEKIGMVSGMVVDVDVFRDRCIQVMSTDVNNKLNKNDVYWVNSDQIVLCVPCGVDAENHLNSPIVDKEFKDKICKSYLEKFN